jgi:signal recognition particle subunit SEC65
VREQLRAPSGVARTCSGANAAVSRLMRLLSARLTHVAACVPLSVCSADDSLWFHCAPTLVRSGWVCVYALFIDADMSREDGRKISLDFACQKPNIKMMADVLHSKGFELLVEENKRHPRDFLRSVPRSSSSSSTLCGALAVVSRWRVYGHGLCQSMLHGIVQARVRARFVWAGRALRVLALLYCMCMCPHAGQARPAARIADEVRRDRGQPKAASNRHAQEAGASCIDTFTLTSTVRCCG